MMNIRIYQINGERDYNRVRFMSMDFLQKYCGSPVVDSSIYDRVFIGDVDCETLEDIYVMFNTNHPDGYVGCSLSVSDVVEIVMPNKKSVFYFCDSIGFRRIDFNPAECEIVNAVLPPETITALLVQPNNSPQVIEIEPKLEILQELVGGNIEMYTNIQDGVAIICNEEGKVNGMPPNRAIYDDSKSENSIVRKIFDIIHGDFLVVYAPEESEEFASLPKDLIEKYTKKFLYSEAFLRIGDEMLVFPIKPVRDEKER